VSIQTSASRDGGATWSTPKNLTSPSPRALNPQISADSAGNAIAIWYLQGPSLAEHVQIRASSDGGDTWNSAVDLSDGKGAYWPRIDLDAAGNAIAIWEHDDSNGKSTVKARSSRDVGATWNPEVNLSAAAAVGAPEISFGFAGYAIAIWMSFDGAGWSIQTSASRDAGATWDSVVDLTAAGQSEFFPQISADASGNAIAVWWTEGVDDVIQTSWLAAPALPDTGAKASVIGTSTAIAAGLLAAGALALIMVRRRLARE
jgi:hypothetical protein